MSTHSLFHRSLAATFVLTVAGLAFARQPPALVQAQTQAEHAAVCDAANVRAGAGYRDSLVRFGAEAPSTSVRTTIASRAGYRGRFEVQQAPQIACDTPAHAPRMTASR
jgi:hypothetical protein